MIHFKRFFSKLTYREDFAGDTERRTAAYKGVRENSSTGSTHKLPLEVEFQKKSVEHQISNDFIKLWWRSTDRQIVISLIILFAFSLMLVTTTGAAVANRIGLEENYFSLRQIFYLIAALGLIILFLFFNTKWLKRIHIKISY